MTDSPTNENPEILSVNVDENLGVVSVGPGGEEPAHPEEAMNNALDRYVEWKRKPARLVTDDDVMRLLEEARIMARLCHFPSGKYAGANAISHNQIDDTDPLRFFVSNSGEIIVNPEMISHTKVPVDSFEGCTSFISNEPKTVKRYNVATVRFQQVNNDAKLSDPRTETFSGVEAKVMQHELAHLNGHSIYDADVKPQDAEGLTLPK